MGVAFITFDSINAQKNFKKYFKDNKKCIKKQDRNLYSKLNTKVTGSIRYLILIYSIGSSLQHHAPQI